eukprot:1179892-Prorocentrum_minimum.AAC.3
MAAADDPTARVVHRQRRHHLAVTPTPTTVTSASDPISLRFAGPPVPITARVHSTPQNIILLRFMSPPVPIIAREHSTPQNIISLRFAGPPVPITAREHSTPQNIILLRFTGPPVSITARVHSTPQNIRVVSRRRGPRQGWSTGHKAPRWAAGETGSPRPKCVYGRSPVTTDHP